MANIHEHGGILAPLEFRLHPGMWLAFILLVTTVTVFKFENGMSKKNENGRKNGKRDHTKCQLTCGLIVCSSGKLLLGSSVKRIVVGNLKAISKDY